MREVILCSETTIREAIKSAKPGELTILSFPKNLDQEVRQILADTWDEYTYAMNLDKENVAILSFIPEPRREASGNIAVGGDVL